jgi:hypothetical protein
MELVLSTNGALRVHHNRRRPAMVPRSRLPVRAPFQIGDPEQVTGRGTWVTFDSIGSPTGSGNFQVTRLVKFNLAPGSVPGQPTFHAGLAFFRITYDDGSQGVLVVGCHLPGSPPPVPEGFSASRSVGSPLVFWSAGIGRQPELCRPLPIAEVRHGGRYQGNHHSAPLFGPHEGHEQERVVHPMWMTPIWRPSWV